MSVRTTSKDSRGFGSNKVLDSHSLRFSSTKRTGGGTSPPPPPAALGHVTTDLIFYVDAADSSSYSGSGTTWTDLSGQGNNMTLSGSPSHTSGSGGYFTFDGSDDKGSVNISTFNSGHNPITLEAWVKVLGGTSYRHIFGARSTTASDDFAFYMLLLSSFQNVNTIEARLNTNSNVNSDITYTRSGGWNSWSQIVLSYDTSDDKTRLYLNSSLVGTLSGTDTGSFGTANPFTVGRTSSDLYATNMQGSKFLIYTKALSSSEISQNYNAFKGEFGL